MDSFRVELPYFPPGTYNLEAAPKQVAAEEKWFPHNEVYSQMNPANLRKNGFLHDESCFNLYRGLFITPKGVVNPCCFATKVDHQFGNLLHDDLATIWNNKTYQQSRALFSRKPIEQAGTLCDSCFLFKRPLSVKLSQQKNQSKANRQITFYDDPHMSESPNSISDGLV